MTSSRLSIAIVGLAGIGTLLSGSVGAQQVIRIVNADNREIPIETNSSVQLDAQGNLIARCALTAGICTALGSGGQVGAPTATLTRTDTQDPVTAGSSVTLSWSSTNADVCNASAGTGNPVATNWAGPKATSGAGLPVLVPNIGAYDFNLRCFNGSGASQLQTVSVTVQEATSGGTNGCFVTDPLISPASMTRVNRTWVQAFSSPNGQFVGVYPISPPAPVPIGSNKGTYTVVPFLPNANQNVQLTWDQAQPNSGYGYGSPRVTNGGMFISISPCAGDLRAINNGTSDPFERTSCRTLNTAASLTFSTVAGPNTVCRLTPGVQYYYTISPVDPSDGISPGEETCNNATFPGCDVQASQRTL